MLNYTTANLPTHPFVNRRHAGRVPIRCPVYLIAGTSLLDAEIGSDYREQPYTLYGETRELSDRGASVVIRSVSLDERACAKGHSVQLVLELPVGQIRMEAKLVHCEPADRWRPESGYLLGVEVVWVEDEDQEFLTEYLLSLR